MKREYLYLNKDILIEMETRSQTKYNNSSLYEVSIDFDGASEAWKQNKLSIGNGSYRYLCKKRGIRNNICKKNVCKVKNTVVRIYTFLHFKRRLFSNINFECVSFK